MGILDFQKMQSNQLTLHFQRILSSFLAATGQFHRRLIEETLKCKIQGAKFKVKSEQCRRLKGEILWFKFSFFYLAAND